MGKNILTIIRELKKHYPKRPATNDEIDAVKNRVSYELPYSLIQLWRSMNGVSIFAQRNSPYRILSTHEFMSADDTFTFAQQSEHSKSWYVFCDVQDANFAGIDLATVTNSGVECRDLFHEMYPDAKYCKVIAHSLEEFISKAIEAGDRLFWL